MQEVTFSEDQQLLEKVREGDDKGMLELYRLYRDGFIHWVQQNYKFDEEIAADAYQDAMVSLHNHVVKGRLFELSSSLQAYLQDIGENIIRKKFNKTNVVSKEDNGGGDTLTTEIIDSIDLNKRQQLVSSLLNIIEEPCRTILRLSYFKRFSIEAVAQCLEDKNEKIAKTQKLRCISTLKKMVRERYSSDSDFYTVS